MREKWLVFRQKTWNLPEIWEYVQNAAVLPAGFLAHDWSIEIPACRYAISAAHYD
jgi:hypothetical protein